MIKYCGINDIYRQQEKPYLQKIKALTFSFKLSPNLIKLIFNTLTSMEYK
jgi:hypothetical protein